MSFFDADDDWQESFRRRWYPRLHPFLSKFGGYAVGRVGWDQYVGHCAEDEEVIEEELVAAGAVRNPIAALKRLPDGRLSEGSWVFRPRSDPTGQIEPGMHVHITLFERDDGLPGRELYAHYEDDWRISAHDHLVGTNFDAARGVEIATELLNEHTFLTLYRK